MKAHTIIFLLAVTALINMSVYSRGNEYTGTLQDKHTQSVIEQQKREIENLKSELSCKEADITELQKMNTNEAGFSAEGIIYFILFSVITGLISGSVIKRKAEAQCKCLVRRKLIMQQRNQMN